MLEDGGRFLRSMKQNSIRLTADGMSIDGVTIIHKPSDGGTPQTALEVRKGFDLDSDPAIREKLQKIARYLDEGRHTEAIFLATMSKWHLAPNTEASDLSKANFNPAEPRNRGEWSETAGFQSPDIEEVQYRGYYHDFVLNHLLESLTSHGAVAIKNVRVFGVNGILAIPDGASLPWGFVKPFFIEMKTGFDPEFTPNQSNVYPLICAGGRAVSFDPRLRQLGLCLVNLCLQCPL